MPMSEDLRVVAEKLLGSFDFDRVHNVMVLLGWKWQRNGLEHVPEVPELRESARELLDALIRQGHSGSISSGGFVARRVTYTEEGLSLRLSFVVEEKTAGLEAK